MQITIDLTDAEAAIVTRQNGGAYPSDAAFIEATVRAQLPSWSSAQDQVDFAAFKAAPSEKTKAEILATAKEESK